MSLEDKIKVVNEFAQRIEDSFNGGVKSEI